MRRLAVLPLLLCAAAAPDPAVYTCRVTTTGTDARNRPEVVRDCLRQVVVKLSGDPGLADAPLSPDATVTDLAFLDRMTDIRLHDEQGTRDRPFDVLGRVEPGVAEAALAAAGGVPWTAPRPVLRVRVEMTDIRGERFVLTGDGARGERQRRALLDAAKLFAVPVSLPAEGVDTAPPSPALAGTLRWSDADFGWVAEWHLGGDAWTVRGVSFDAAFRAGVGGAAQRLAAASRR